MKSNHSVCTAALGLMAALTLTQSALGGLLGHTLGYQYYFPDAASVYYTAPSFVVGAGVELADLIAGANYATVDFSDNNIYIDFRYPNSSSWTAMPFNGFRVYDVNGTVPAITSVTINPATNMAGLDASRITFDAYNIYVNWQDLPFDSNTIVSLDVNAGPVNQAPVITLNGANPVTLECYVDTYAELGATATDAEDGTIPVVISGTVDRTHVGVYTRTYTATDSGGKVTTVTRTVRVVDTLPPAITVPADIIIPSVVAPASGPAVSDPIFYSPTPTASDRAVGNVTPVVSPRSGSRFGVGRHPVTVTATDPSGNTASKTFYVVVLEHQASPLVRFMDTVALRGQTIPGITSGTITTVNRAYVNNNSDVIYDATIAGAGANDSAVFYGALDGSQATLAVKGNASGQGNYGAFSNLTLNHTGHSGFESAIGGYSAQFKSVSGAAPTAAAIRTKVSPAASGALYGTLYQPAMASDGQLLTSGYLQIGTGVGVTAANDTLITSSANTIIAREGDPTSIAGVTYGQIHPRIVASRAAEKYAFAAYLETAVFDANTNTGLFMGTLGGGRPALVVREGDTTAGVATGKFFQFLGESVNSAGEVAFRSSITGGAAVTAANNEGLWTTAGRVGLPPVLVARKGAITPLRPLNQTAFSRFTTIHMQDDGSVVFFAYLQNAGTFTTVNSNNDGSIWRWKDGTLTLLAREGEIANNTAGARLLNINGFDCNDRGGIVYDATLLPGVGDTTTATNQAVFINRGNGMDPAPLLVMRRNDSFKISGTDHTVAGIKISTDVNSGGGTGGYGRTINDNGEVVFNLTLSGNKSGIFLLGTAPPN